MSEPETTVFDNWAPTYDACVARSENYYERYEDVLEAAASLAEAAGPEALDIGTGTGNLALKLAGRGLQTTAVDPSVGMLRVARAKSEGIDNVGFVQVQEPFVRLPFVDGTFDAVVSTYAFHHVPAELKAQAVVEMLRVVRPGGVWGIGDIVFANESAESEALARYADWLEREWFARVDEMQALFAGLGMELHSQQFTPVSWLLWSKKPRKTSRAV